MWSVNLPDLETTAAFGRALAQLVINTPTLACILLHGDLGSGKTTLVRSLVYNLPGGGEAEVSSPSFTLCNAYPTTPPVLHCDLYRSEASFPDEVADALDGGGQRARLLTIIEWAEYVPAWALPEDYLDIRLETCEADRLAVVKPYGDTVRASVLTLQHQDWMTR